MFSGCRPQAKRSFRSILRSEKGFNIFYTASFLRHLWSAHVNDRKRNLYLESRSRCSQFRTQCDAINLPEDSASGSNSTGERAIHNGQSSGENKLQNNIARLATHPDPIDRAVLGQTPHPQSHGKSPHDESLSRLGVPATDDWQGMTLYRPRLTTPTQEPTAKPSNWTKTRDAYEIERENIWRMKWQKRQTRKRRLKARNLRKGERIYAWEVPLTIAWNRNTPVSEFRRRGRLFRLKHWGEDAGVKYRPGVHVPWVEEPSAWTKVNFDSYVHELANVKPRARPVVQAFNSGSGMKVEARSTRERGVVLSELMHRKMSHAFIEPEVCNIVIKFLLLHRMLREARSILFLMEHLNLHIPPSTFNLFLRMAVHYNDLAAFSSILHIMRDRHVRRNGETLMLLLWCLRSRKRKSAVIRAMEMAGTRLMNRRMRRAIISATIKQDIVQDIEAGNSPLDFIRRMRRIHKMGWINTRIGNIILDQVCKRVSLAAGLALLLPLRREGFRPDIITLRTPLFLACSHHSHDKVAKVLHRFASKYNIHPDPACYEKMWHLAWQRRHLNVSALLFISACLNGAVPAEMHNMILLSVKINTDRLRLRARDYVSYRPTSATHAPEIDNPNSPLQQRAVIRQPGWASRVYICMVGNFVLNMDPWVQWKRYLALHTMKSIIRHLAQGRFKLKYSLAYHYSKAYALDAEWKIFEGKDVNEKLGDPCVIELALKDQAGERRKGHLGDGLVNYFVRSKPWLGPQRTDKAYWLGPQWA